MGAAALELARREHDLDRVADLYVAAFEQAAGGGAVSDAVLRRREQGSRRGGDRARLREASEIVASASARSSSVVDRLRAVPGWAALAAIVVLSFVVRAWLARGMLGPFIMVDELIYSELAKSFASDLRFAVRDVPVRGYGVVYPILISPAYAIFDRMPDVYATVKTINSLVMSLAAVPTYLLARRVVGKWLGAARGAARRCGPVDGLHGDGDDRERVLPDLSPRRARARAHCSSGRRCSTRCSSSPRSALAYLTRSQAIVIGRCGGDGADPVRPVPRDGFKRRCGRTGGSTRSSSSVPFSSSLAQTARGMPLSSLLGSYAVVASGGNYDVGKAAHFVVYHLAELDLYLGVIPVAAAIVLTARARTARPGAPGAPRRDDRPRGLDRSSSSARSRPGSPTGSRSATSSRSRRCS